MTLVRRLGLLAPLGAIALAGCGINSVPTAEEQVNAAWGNVQSEYQRRNGRENSKATSVHAYSPVFWAVGPVTIEVGVGCIAFNHSPI